jgi:DNA-binding NarL/FixJ family response regulator
MKETTILIADDHPLFRAGVKDVLKSENQYNIIGEAGNGNDAYDLIIKLNPDIAVLDFQMPGLCGIEIAEKLKAMNHPVKIILLTMHNARKIFLRALGAGVSGYVLKDDAVLDIKNAINTVLLGNEYISNSLISILTSEIKVSTSQNSNCELISKLTGAEKKILALIADLKTNEEISDTLFVSKRTIENHKSSIARKLALDGAKGLLKFAIQNKEII